ncbi:MAG TPA: ABC transporter permease [Polyangia bacterium]|jgi:ABC-2 type transport system permease protein|nr:ABC transporter permease [Polyangia bacterium]
MWRSFLAVFRKEFLHIFRDAGTLRLALMLPVMQLVLFGFIDQTVHDLPTSVVDQDQSIESRLFQDQLRATRTFKILDVTTDPEHARQQIRSGRARVAVVIPPRFHDHRIRGTSAQVLVLIDGSDSTASAQALASINGLVASDNQPRLETILPGHGAIAAQPIVLFNPEGRTANYIIPGLVAVLLQLLGIVLSAGAIVRERERGTFEQLLVTPIDPLGLMLGKLCPYLVLSLVEMTLILIAMRFGFGVPIRGSVFVLYGIALFYLSALLSLGLLISTRARTQMEAQQMGQLLFLPGVFLSGYIFPFEGMPVVLRGIGLLFPVTHMIAVMRGVVLRNASVVDLWPHIAALLAMSIVLVWLGARSIRKVVA